MGHFYTTNGEPKFFVEKKAREGQRPTTIDDARRNGWLPSVTEILKILDKPALNQWKIQQGIIAVCSAPDIPGEGIDAKIARVLAAGEHDEESKRARDLGSQIHAAIENRLQDKPFDPSLADYFSTALNHVFSLGKVLWTEKILVGDGYAGKCDLAIENENYIWLLDWKTAKTLPDPNRGAWLEHRLQLAAYAKAFEKHYKKNIFTGNVYISTRERGRFVVCDHSVGWHETYERGFKPLVQYWKWVNIF